MEIKYRRVKKQQETITDRLIIVNNMRKRLRSNKCIGSTLCHVTASV